MPERAKIGRVDGTAIWPDTAWRWKSMMFRTATRGRQLPDSGTTRSPTETLS